jgi:hypothetical protein
MTTKSTPVPQTDQNKSTLKKPGNAHPVPLSDVNLPAEVAEENEVAGRHKNSGQKDHKGAR